MLRYNRMRTETVVTTNVLRGLRSTLLGAAGLTPAHTYAVLTTAPGQWLGAGSEKSISVIDVSSVIGASPWKTESDLEDFVVSQLLQLGWTQPHLRVQQRLDSDVAFLPDITLCNEQTQPVAIIEVKALLETQRIEQLVAYQQSIAARLPNLHFFVTDGHTTLQLETNAKPNLVDQLPTPRDLGVQIDATEKTPLAYTSRTGVTYPKDTDELLSALAFQPDPVFIVDHTLPWGDRSSSKIERMAELLPKKIRAQLNRLDSALPFVFASLTAVGATRGLIAVVFGGFLFNTKYEPLRKALHEWSPLRAVVSLPAVVFAPLRTAQQRMVPPALIAMGEFGAPSKDVLFIPVSNAGELMSPQEQPWWDSFISGLKGSPPRLGFCARVGSAETWEPNAYRPASSGIETMLRNLSEVKLLGELCDILQGVVTPRNEAPRGKGRRVIRSRDISNASVLSPDDIEWFDIDSGSVERSPHIVAGDVLLQRIGSTPSVSLAGLLLWSPSRVHCIPVEE